MVLYPLLYSDPIAFNRWEWDDRWFIWDCCSPGAPTFMAADVLTLNIWLWKSLCIRHRSFRVDSERHNLDVFSDICTTYLNSYGPTFISIKHMPLIRNWLSMMLHILWLVGTRLLILHFIVSTISSLLEQVCAAVSAIAKIRCFLRQAGLFKSWTNSLWYSTITKTFTFRDGDGPARLLQNLYLFQMRCDTF